MLIASLALLLVQAAPSPAALPPPAPVTAPAPLAAPGPGIVRVRMTTTEGPILLDLDVAKAPLTAGNFLKYVDGRRLDNSTIYRVVKSAPGFGFIQGGIQNDPKKILPGVAHEPTSKTGLTHSDGTISLPRGAPGTGHGEFFIVVGDIPSMDADPTQPGDNLGYAAFGHVVSGMDIIRPMIERPTSPTLGGPALHGSMLATPIKILSVRRAN
jgi:peptidyl-prolyl cis-trans isomerase A (cyclophilin A)